MGFKGRISKNPVVVESNEINNMLYFTEYPIKSHGQTHSAQKYLLAAIWYFLLFVQTAISYWRLVTTQQQFKTNNEENLTNSLKSTPNSRFSIKPKQNSCQYSPQIIKLLRIMVIYSSSILRPTQLSLCVEHQFFQNQVNLLRQTTQVTKTEALEAKANELNNYYQTTQSLLKFKMFPKIPSLTNFNAKKCIKKFQSHKQLFVT
ncbi:Hypothetical_protein [Hexamita inflata]|uniref:Hypothetical_protein n=1 Tax=Hexamita inflata TaxID=28002 RepID=A0AA86PK44_9EUKA|nr:Hypothetical protein HINF_LOCUS24369 [Hexamita inflata]